MKKLLLPLLLLFAGLSRGQTANDKIPLLFRLDDIGMCHDVNRAAKEVLDAGFPVSMSVMVPCPWFTEAADLLKNYPQVSVGIHLTLNSEWKNFRWGPVAGVNAVPSLVDSLGHFFPSRSKLYGNNPRMEEIEKELRAQIDKALRTGLKIDYLDYHMGAAMQTLETRAIVEKLAKEYGLVISRYYDEVDVEGGYSAPVEGKLDTLIRRVKNLEPGGTKLFVVHIGLDGPEMGAMEDLNPSGPRFMSRHREAELRALLDPAFLRVIRDNRFRLVNYRMLKEERGLETMKRPARL